MDPNHVVEGYGHIVVDECDHLSPFSFERILKHCNARYVLGLTATPFCRDGHQPIIFMQCGPIRHIAEHAARSQTAMEVLPRFLDTRRPDGPDDGIQVVFRKLAEASARNQRIVADVVQAHREGRHVLVLTERTEHLAALSPLLAAHVDNLIVLHGRLARKARASVLDALNALPEDAPRVLLATGRLIGEGFDHACLDTLALALPISWKGTLQKYAGRLHREHAAKSSIRIYDYVDTQYPALVRMWEKRQRGYRAMGYLVVKTDVLTG